MRNAVFFLLLLLSWIPSYAQISGRVTDSSGQPLPFASIYIQGTSVGSTSNAEGYYKLEPKVFSDSVFVVFQYVGFETRVIPVDFSAGTKTLDIALEEESVLLSTVEIRPTDEDPAYSIIRKAIEKRRYYLELIPEYSCNVYIKGGLSILDAPKKILGQEVGDMNGNLDSTGRGIIYLSESESKWNVQRPNKYKEIMVSSKVSGNDNGFSFNSASDVNFDFYENTTDYSRPIVSPIAYNAMGFYKYALIGTIFDEAGRMIFKIKIEPRQPELAAYGGFIYIVEELYNIQGVDVFVTGASLNEPALDTIFIRQVHVPVRKPDAWRLFSQTITIKGDILGFKFGGDFTSIYRNYELQPTFPKGFFDNESFKVEEGANEKGLAHFDTIRPLPLSPLEFIDYNKKDSLQVIRESRPYLDSLDRKNNKFTPLSLLMGYTYNRSFKRESFTFESPANSLQFHTVHGWYGYLGLRYRKAYDRFKTRRLESGLKMMYGFSEKRPRLSGDFQYDFNRTHFSRIRLSGGLEPQQFNRENPISPSLNSMYSLWGKRNYSKVFEKAFGRLEGRHELFNGVLLEAGFEYARRKPLQNTSEYSFVPKIDREYTSNIPETEEPGQPETFIEHTALLVDVNLRLRLNQEYISYPKIKFVLESKWPDLWIRYRAGIAPGAARFHYLSLSLEKESFQMGVAGQSGFFLQAGRFFKAGKAFFMDYRHFNGNQTIFGNPLEYRHRFFLLPYYQYSTLAPHAQAHWEHQFQGFLFDKIPLIRKLGLSEVFSAKALWVEGRPLYWEAAIGVDQLGWGLFRLFRVDVAASFSGAGFEAWGVVLGVKLPGNLN